MSDLTQNRLKSILHYDPETGVFTWIDPPGFKFKPGDKAGFLRKDGYLQIKIDKKGILAHRLAWLYMTGKWNEKDVDHINGDRSDNRWENLRECLHSHNGCNMKKPSHNTSGFKGVSWDPSIQRWKSKVGYKGKKYISMHKHYWQAVRATIRKRERLHGEYARHR